MITLSTSGWKSGLREWIVQRITGLDIGIYFNIGLRFRWQIEE